MGRIARSWALVKASATILRSDRELLVFPLLSTVCSLIVVATFMVPAILSGPVAKFDQGGDSPWLWPLVFLFYLIQYFVIFFFNAALVGAARIRLDGGDPSVADGLRIAAARWPQILGYAAIAATVGMILRAIQERAGLIGRWITGLLGVAWTVASFLVVPVLVSEDLGPIDAVKRSASLLKQTWGENLAGNIGTGLVFGLIAMVWIFACLGLLALAISTQSAVAIVAIVVVMALGIILIGLVQSALQGIYAAVLHRYACSGDVGSGFDGALVAGAFKVKA
ncbi:DUF6159 family protein [Dokdonella sp.]|uniref:DUF6159 family protein n=1 Tax=Dokdonella sp. TaxID=2291710 RepID=UPI0031C66679|nr:DUF6159 family protein [Dokdonella sp.]